MDLTRAAQLVPYLSRLGVSHLYLSPVFQAVPESTHGYDVIRPDQIDPTLGGRAAFDRLAGSLRGQDMGLILDIVPNHMAAHWANPWWADVLERGQESRYADYFNISWERGQGKVILPYLGAPLPEILERGELEIVPEGGGEGPGFGPHLRYHEHRFPLAGSSPVLPNLPRGAAGSAKLHELLEQQNYRLVDFRETELINYGRFFDVSSLVSLRIEEPEVFAAVHRLPLELIDSGAVQGLRVDHVDGLRDPEAYLLRLQEAADAASHGRPFYVIVEKILERDEELPPSWPVSGTTGYEFLNAANVLLVSPTGLPALEDLYREITGDRRGFDEVLYESKREILSTLFRGEVRALVELIRRIPGVEHAGPELESGSLTEALVELTACLPVYRTYVSETAAVEDRDLIAHAAECAQRRDATAPTAGLAFLRGLFSLSLRSRPLEPPPEALEAVARWQQLSGPAMAKGLEDTAFYRHHRLVALNEVGGYAEHPQDAVAHFHRLMARHAREWPGTLNATSTHDTKRSEEARARLAALSEMPDTWRALVQRWEKRFGSPNTAAADRMLLYQSAFAIWGAPRAELEERLTRFVVKALREGKERSAWLNPERDHEAAMLELVLQLLGNEEFRGDMDELLARAAPAAALNSLSQTLLKLAAPGIPDIYQGMELREFNLVDPDNRGAVDFEERERLLEGLGEGEIRGGSLFADPRTKDLVSGRLKLQLIVRGLDLRSSQPQLFAEGDYLPLMPEGPRAAHLVAFARRLGSAQLIAVAPRLTMEFGTPEFWKDTRLPLPASSAGPWRDVITGTRFEFASDLSVDDLPHPPLALLVPFR